MQAVQNQATDKSEETKTNISHRASSETAWKTSSTWRRARGRGQIVIKASGAEGTVVNTEAVMSTATGVVISHDTNLLAKTGT